MPFAAALEKRPDHPATLYNLACAEALAGRADDALAHLRRALELRPEWAEMAQEDEDFASVRDSPGAMIEFGLERSIHGLPADLDRLLEDLASVTVRDVARAARTVALDTVYLLRD